MQPNSGQPRPIPSRRHYRSHSSPCFTNTPVTQQDYASLPSSPAVSFLAQFAAKTALNEENHGLAVGDLWWDDQYLVGEQIAPACHTQCHRVTRLSDGQELAAKILVSEERSAFQSFAHELNVWESLSHPHIMPLLAVSRDCLGGVMPWCELGNLQQWLRGHGQVGKVQAKTWLRQLAGALAYLHERGISHGDVKLENIILSSQDHLLLSDFGLSKCQEGCEACSENDHGPAPAARLVLPKGTLFYLAPEQIEAAMEEQPGQAGPSPSADCWAMGVCLYALLSGGRLPFADDYVPGLVQSIRTMTYAPVPVEDEGIQLLLSGLLAADPARRLKASHVVSLLSS